jgi:hypothetical protein
MPEAKEKLAELRQEEYDKRLEVDRLRREVYGQEDPSASAELFEELGTAEDALREVEEKLSKAAEDDPKSGLILDSKREIARRGVETTGLEAKVHLRMAQIPTSYVHLLDAAQDPLISCNVYVSPTSESTRRVRVSSFIEGYSARAIETFELAPDHEHSFDQLPTLFLDRIRDLDELTRASLNVLVEDLDGKVELHVTQPIWLLARTTAPLAVRDPQTGGWRDMKRYLGAFVTPNARDLMKFLRAAAERHPSGRLVGYQVGEEEVALQVKALFEALKEEADITYVNSVVDFSPDQGFTGQRVRLPRESLSDHQANCIDGTVLFASLLEGISINPAIVVVPGHAFLAWETWRDSGVWKYLETTMIGTHTFEEACQSAERTAAYYGKQKRLTQLSLKELRANNGIFPME